MKNKYRIFLIALGVSCSISGCSEPPRKNPNTTESQSHQTNETPTQEQGFPEHYENSIERVTFQCDLEMPEALQNTSLSKLNIEGYRKADRTLAYEKYVEGKNIIEEYHNPTTEDDITEDTYILENNTTVTIDKGLTYSTQESLYYLQLGVYSIVEQLDTDSEQVSLNKPEEYITQLKQTLEEINFSTEDFEFTCYPLTAQTLQTLEKDAVQQGNFPKENCKESWTDTDDIYIISGYQMAEGLPINHELMNMFGAMAYDTADNGSILAIYSGRGLESLSESYVYEVKPEKEQITLKSFDEIASAVAEKFNSILNEAEYTVTRARLFERVYWNQKQELTAEPVWYFEVVENNSTKSVALIHGETGKEIFLD